ncbi:MAG: DUF1499 domain-containing protein [Blastocatellales bacterium]
MKFNKIFPAILVGIILVASSPFILGLIWPRINDVKTGQTPEYADIQPQKFNQPLEKVCGEALAVSQAMGWELRESKRDSTGCVIEAIATTRLFKFKDDVTVTITNDNSVTIVNVRSKSRIGKGDLGTNARRIRTFQADLAKRL